MALKNDTNTTIPVHPLPPRFVDSPTQPVVLWRIWNIQSKKFDRKRTAIPTDFSSKKEKERYIFDTIQEINDIIQNGGYTYTDKKALEKIDKKHGKNYTIKQAIENFITFKSKSLSPKSIDAYNYNVSKLLKYCEETNITDTKITAFTLEQAYEFCDSLYNDPSLSPKTYNDIISMAKSVFHFYQKRQLITKNPFDDMERKVVQSAEAHYPFTLDQIAQLKEAMLANNDHQLWLFVSIIYYTAIRPHEELRYLKIKDIEEKTIYIPSNRAKNNTRRRVAISAPLEKLFKEYQIRNVKDKNLYVFSAKQEPSETHCGLNYFYKRHVKYLKKLGFTYREYSLYSWKHTGNIQAFISGTDIYTLKELNGHKSIAQTENYLRKMGAIRPHDVETLKHPAI